jgi:hypothetical protein
MQLLCQERGFICPFERSFDMILFVARLSVKAREAA